VLKCVKGGYAGKFIYMNLTPEGETIGSDPKNESLTLCIEGSGLSSQHCKIVYQKDETSSIYRYVLSDLDSETGILEYNSKVYGCVSDTTFPS